MHVLIFRDIKSVHQAMECRYKAHDTKDGVRVSEFQYVIFPPE